MKLPTHPAVFVLPFAFAGPLAAEEPARVPIWKISDEDSTVYLAGSVHLLREQDLPIPAAFDRVYAESEELVFEIDMAAMMRPGAAAEMLKLGSLPEGETIADRFGTETVERLRGYLKEQGVAPSLFDRFSPGMIFLTLSSLEAARQGAKTELGLETTYFGKSVADGKPSRGLETIAYQVQLFDRFEDASIEKWIHRTLDEPERSAETLEAIMQAWRRGDGQGIAERLAQDDSMPPELREALLDERNRNWIPEIERALATDRDVMFLVGAAHLAGEGSVVDLLREKGLKVTQLANDE